MKKAIIALALVSSHLVFANPVTLDIPQEECQQTCELYAYNFQADTFGYCKQVEKCDVLEWNEDLKVCELLEESKFITYPIACRDIPAY